MLGLLIEIVEDQAGEGARALAEGGERTRLGMGNRVNGSRGPDQIILHWRENLKHGQEQRRADVASGAGCERACGFRHRHLVEVCRVLRMVKRRALEAERPSFTCCHTFRATGITACLENGGTIGNAA
jgi:hypothetical protein